MIQATYWVGLNVHISNVLKERGLQEDLLSYLYPICTVVSQFTNALLGWLKVQR